MRILHRYMEVDMNERKAIIFAVRVVGLSVINFLVWIVVSSAVSGALGISVHSEIEQSMTAVMLLMLATSFCNTAVLCYAVVRSKFSRLKLVVIVFLVYFGVNTFISQIETIYFNESLNIPGMEIFSFFLTGFITALIFSPLAVLIMGKFRRGGAQSQQPRRLPLNVGGPVGRAAIVAAVVYPVLYFGFGYFVLWQFPAAREMYSGSTEKLPFFIHMARTIQNDPWFYPWQVLRGILWVLLALPVIRMSMAKWRETGVQVGLLFAVLMNAQHLLPNPYIPLVVRMAHLLETATSNFILGFLTVYFICRLGRKPLTSSGRSKP